ncbi:hypothetical protein A9Q98_02535 [Thalassotalea sp. 42_200_T64]|nr:hypothetical protein A9Q98_02535 [Thalassotalea sp. 42_200_T64]
MFDIVSCRQDIDQVIDIARIIWTEHYTPIIGIEQVEYMLSNFQSAQTITEQISTGNHQYYLIINLVLLKLLKSVLILARAM